MKFLIPLFLIFLFTLRTHATSSEELAKKLANPVASLISLPIQFNYDKGVGFFDGDRTTVNLQPVVPFSVGKNWNLITRTILPVISQNNILSSNSGNNFGLSDTIFTAFLSPKSAKNGLTWGIGPAFLIPTATENSLGRERWGAGPSTVVLKQQGKWTYGALANHLWHFAGNKNKGDVNTTFIQPFLNYITPKATTVFLNSEASYDWIGNSWIVPINLGVNQLLNFGKQKVQLGGGLRYWVETPDSGPDDLGFRFQVIFLFPR